MIEKQTTKFEMIAKTFSGLEPILAKELESIKAEKITIGRRMVSFVGDEECMYKANIYLRTAIRILKPIFSTKIKTQDEYYNFFRETEWEKYMGLHHTFVIDSVINTDVFNHSLYAAQRAKDGIVDRFKAKYFKRPNVDTENPDLVINVHFTGQQLNISLDSSGQPLSKRGYRVGEGAAPLNQVLAAAMILNSDWDPTTPFVDPMTGSGTLAIEAAMIARHIPPGLIRKEFAFKNWIGYNKALYKKIIDEVELNEIRPKIFANDISEEIIEIARINAQKALVSSYIRFSNKDIADYKPRAKDALVIINPPYGERLKPEQIEKLYADIGSSLKFNFSGSQAWIISSNTEALKHIGLRPSKKMHLYNGSLDCTYARFDLFDGSLKEHKESSNEK
jgi:putative N6-adenine-specific DNA methylase